MNINTVSFLILFFINKLLDVTSRLIQPYKETDRLYLKIVTIHDAEDN